MRVHEQSGGSAVEPFCHDASIGIDEPGDPSAELDEGVTTQEACRRMELRRDDPATAVVNVTPEPPVIDGGHAPV